MRRFESDQVEELPSTWSPEAGVHCLLQLNLLFT
jgi:hypothetical protein